MDHFWTTTLETPVPPLPSVWIKNDLDHLPHKPPPHFLLHIEEEGNTMSHAYGTFCPKIVQVVFMLMPTTNLHPWRI